MYHLNRLRYALSQANDLAGPAGAEAAYEVANCLGRCRVSGTEIPTEENGTLDLELALKATRHARWLTERVKQSVARLVARQDQDVESEDGFYELDCRTGAIITRHELWCAMLAIHEADDARSRDGEGSGELSNELVLLIEELAVLDALMIRQIQVFIGVTDFPLLSNLWAMVETESLPKLEPLPWWLNGTIERVAEQVMARFLESLPDPRVIERKLRQR